MYDYFQKTNIIILPINQKNTNIIRWKQTNKNKNIN